MATFVAMVKVTVEAHSYEEAENLLNEAMKLVHDSEIGTVVYIDDKLVQWSVSMIEDFECQDDLDEEC